MLPNLPEHFSNPRRIENVPLEAIINGTERINSDNKILISITDFSFSFQEPKSFYKEIHHFKFADIEDPVHANFNIDGPAITDEQAERLVSILQNCLKNNIDVVVHCHAGICRSGAVVEVAEMMGFLPIHTNRMPNTLVKRKMMKVLGWTYD